MRRGPRPTVAFFIIRIPKDSELELPMLNILLQYVLTNFIVSNTLFKYHVDNLIELSFILSLS